LRSELIRTKYEGLELPSQHGKCMSAMCKIADKNAQDADCPKKCANIGEVSTRTPYRNLGNKTIVRNATARRTSVANDAEFLRTEYRLKAGKGAARVFHALDYVVDVLEVFPNESVYTWIFCNRFK
jgi:hypothetical protein